MQVTFRLRPADEERPKTDKELLEESIRDRHRVALKQQYKTREELVRMRNNAAEHYYDQCRIPNNEIEEEIIDLIRIIERHRHRERARRLRG